MPRLHAVVLGVFAACSCLLATVGLYGVMASMVAGRRREIGIRLALGARAGEVLRMVIGRGMALAVAGIAAGLALAAVATRLLTSFLFEVDPLDPAVLAGAAAGFAAVALAANLLPAIRAMRVDPVETLAAE
jgi:putative ABC transport system permease protein